MQRKDLIKKMEQSGLGSTLDFLNRNRAPVAKLGPDQQTAFELAEELIRECRLTEYQAQVLLGDTKDRLVFGEYTILDKIGQGGMGVVFKARKDPPSDVVALKVLPQVMSKKETAIRRFTREAELATRLEHPNIVRSIEFGEVDGRHYLAMEFVDGENLSRLMKDKNGLPLLTAFECLRDAVRGLKYAHQQNVIHRDIKPSNLLVHRNGTCKILDMGLARSVVEDDDGDTQFQASELTMTGTVLGTTGYMAPEQALNSKNADRRSDIYSLGCTLFYLLTGQEIYGGNTFVEKIIAHRETSIPNLCDLRQDVPKVVQQMFESMVAKDVERRCQSMSELLERVESCLDEYGHMWMIKRYITDKKGTFG